MKQQVTTRKDRIKNVDVSLLAFGCMRFPVLKKGKPEIDEKQAEAMIDYAYTHGVNYFDTAWPYHEGRSETFIGKALKKYPRESFYLATKMPTWLVDSVDKAKEIFEQQLKNCQVEYFDFYLLHALSTLNDYEEVYEKTGVYEYLHREKDNGRIHRLGFSFHGPKEDFPRILDKHPWDFAMIQANYLDWDRDAEYLYGELEKRNIQCLIMEPVRGGMLATLSPESVKILKDEVPERSISSWAIQFIASKPNVLTVLSGMSTLRQVKDNVQTVTRFKSMTPGEHETLNKALKVFLAIDTIRCTECRYCMPCPAGVEIPLNFHVYNKCVSENYIPDIKGVYDDEFMRKKNEFLKTFSSIPKNQQALACTECNKCMEHCPQHLPIPGKMQEISSFIRFLEGIQ